MQEVPLNLASRMPPKYQEGTQGSGNNSSNFAKLIELVGQLVVVS